jgi:hypothetical protein
MLDFRFYLAAKNEILNTHNKLPKRLSRKDKQCLI